MTTVTWAQLTPGQQALLASLFGWVGNSDVGRPINQAESFDFFVLEEAGLAKMTPQIVGLCGNITPAGLAVWQQGQAASVPRSVWVAKCGDTIISVHTTSESSRLICEEVSGEKLEWETCDVYPDGTHRMVDSSYVYSVEEWRVLP